MKIVVPVKEVGSLDDEIEFVDGGVDPDVLEYGLNEWDEFSVEAALTLKEELDGVEVVAVTLGENHDEDVLLGALAKGVDRAVRIEVDEGTQVGDPLKAARLLAPAIERESPDLVLCGAQASDTVNGATGVALASLIGVPSVAVVRSLELDGEAIVVERELEGGLAQRLKLNLPALLTIQTGINSPRYATLRAIKQARDKPYETVTLADLEIDAAEARGGAEVVALAEPEQGSGAEMLDGNAEAVAARILEIIEERT